LRCTRRVLKTCFIINPRSGCAARAIPEIQAFAAQRKAAVRLTERSRHATDLARQAIADGCDLVVAVGGDGTMNEVATVLVGTSTTFGLVPCGSGDGLGRHLGIHGSIGRALAVLESGHPHAIDTGLADGHAFFTSAGMGFEAEIAQRFNRLTRRGFARYLTTSAKVVHSWQPERYVISYEGRREAVDAFTLTVSNANQYGNNARITPDARVDDGQLDLCTVPPVTFWNGLPLAVHLFHGTIGRVRGVAIRRSAHFVVERTAPGLIQTDGEMHEIGTRVDFTVQPASLRIMVPERLNRESTRIDAKF
jgi:diacylglycerol kinase (ATP)